MMMNQRKTPDPEKARWHGKLRTVSKERRRRIIADAHDIGGLSHQEIANELGDIGRLRVIQIVREVREERRDRAS